MTSEQEDMRKAFEQFMVKKSTQSQVQTKNKQKNSKEEMLLKKAEKKYWQIINAFQGRLERDWLEADDNLERVVSSISNLRNRILMESKWLNRTKNKTMKPWDDCGFREKGASGLSLEDVELALSYDLVQHEKMMAGARTLLSSLSEAQDALGRRLEEMMLHHMNTRYLIEQTSNLDAETSPSLVSIMNVTGKLQDIFASLALELYRKQRLVEDVLDAVNDDLLLRDDEMGDMYENPRRVAEKCVREWPRGTKGSHLDVQVLNWLLGLGDRGNK